MTYSNETITKVFAPYLGHEVKYRNSLYYGQSSFHAIDGNGVRIAYMEIWMLFNQCKLILRPLSSIRDEEAIEVAILAGISKDDLVKEDDDYYKRVVTRGLFNDCSVNYWRRCSHEYEEYDVYSFTINFKSGDCFDYYGGISNQSLIIQYLQSKGFDLPHCLLDGKTLKEAGLAVYE